MSTHNNNNDDPNAYDDQYATEFDDTYDESSDVTPEDDAYVDDASSDEWTEESDDPTPPPAKKKSKMTTVIIVAVAIIGVLGFLVIKGGNKQQATQPLETAASPAAVLPDVGTEQIPADTGLAGLIDAQPSDQQQPVEPLQPANSQQAPQGLMDNPDILTEQPTQLPIQTMTGVEPPQPTADTPPVPEQAIIEPTPTPDALVDTVTDVKPVSDFPTVDSIKKPQTPPVSTTIEQEPETPPVALQNSEQAVVSVTESTNLQEKLDAATAQISDLQKDLSLKDEEIKKQRDQLNAPNPELESLKAKIEELEARLSEKSDMVKEKVTSEAKTEELRIATPSASPQKAKAQTTSISSGRKVIEKKAKWTMKSAKPGRAVLSDATTGDFKTVSIGDTVSGIGRVTSITEGPSGWVIQGTQGKISE